VAGSHSIFRRIEDLNGVVDEPAHKILIGTGCRSLNVFLPGRAATGKKRLNERRYLFAFPAALLGNSRKTEHGAG